MRKRDYLKLSKAELLQYADFKLEQKSKPIITSAGDYEKDLLENYIFHKYESLFPNNEIDLFDLKTYKVEWKKKLELFKNLVANPSTNERNILKFIKSKNAYFLVKSLLINYRFGHHRAYIFPEFQLSNEFRTDFLIIGTNSDGHHFLLIEFENPHGQIVTQKGNLSTVPHKGIMQVREWRRWLPKNFNSFQSTLKKYKGQTKEFNNDFFEFDQERINYLVIAGTRDNFNEVTYQEQREINGAATRIKLLHFTSLIENSELLLDTHTLPKQMKS